MDTVSYSHSAKQAQRIEKFIKNPDSNSGIVTVPKVIGAGENVTVPAGRVAVLPNVQVDGTLNVEGEVFIPSGATLSRVVEKVSSTDNAVVRFNGVTGEVQNSGVVIDDSGNVGIGTSNPSNKLHIYNSGGWNKGVGVKSLNKFIQMSSDSNFGNDIFWDNASILRFSTGSASDSTGYVERMRIGTSGNLLVGTITDNGVDKLQVNGSISALPPSFGIQQQVNNHRKLYCFYTNNHNQNRLKLRISGNTTYLSFVLNIVYSNLYSGSDQSAIREYSFKSLANTNTSNFSEIGTGLGSPVTVISSNVVTGGYEVVLGFNTGGFPQFDIEIINHQHYSIGTITGEFLTV